MNVARKLVVALVLLCGVLPGQEASAATLLHYKFEGAAGSVATSITDVAGTADGTAVGDPMYVADDPGTGATSLDFTADRVSFPAITALTTLTGDLTVEAILKPRNLVSTQFLVSNWPFASGFQFELSIDAGQIVMSFSDGTPGRNDLTSAALPQADTWYHVAGIRDATAGTTRLYVDGVLADSAALQWGLSTDGSAFAIGSRFDGSLAFDGQLAEVRVSDTVLAPADFLCFEAGVCQTPTESGTWGAVKSLYR